MPDLKTTAKPTRTTAVIPADLYGDVWEEIAKEKRAGHKVTMQEIINDSLRLYLEQRKKNAA